MKRSIPTIAVAGCLAGCANVHERPFAADRLGDNEVLRLEREVLERLIHNGRRPDMSAIVAVEGLRCITLNRIGPDTPKCDYRLRYRKLDGRSATMTRRNRYFQRDDEGRWESVVIVTSG